MKKRRRRGLSKWVSFPSRGIFVPNHILDSLPSHDRVNLWYGERLIGIIPRADGDYKLSFSSARGKMISTALVLFEYPDVIGKRCAYTVNDGILFVDTSNIVGECPGKKADIESLVALHGTLAE